jgi:hypothetical protein
MQNNWTIAALLLLLGGLFTACEKNNQNNNNQNNTPLSHDVFDQLLQQHVDDWGAVDYPAFKADEAKLKAYIEHLSVNEPAATWSANKKQAYWINLYNAFTIYNVLLEYPVNSILDLDNGMIWTQRTVAVGNTAYTLDQIEKEQLLAAFNEPKVHFAVNCAAASCPPLLNKAWTETNLQHYYSNRTKSFINDSRYNYLSTDSIAVSKIFDWYATDFGGSENVVAYIQRYADSTVVDSAALAYRVYDWNLNIQ